MKKYSVYFSKMIKIESVQAALILLLFLIVFFSPTIFSGKINSASDNLQKWPTFAIDKDYIRQNSLLSDPMVQSEPWFSFVKEALKKRQLPLWNPYQGNGTPLLANMQSAFFFPLNWLVYFFDFKTGLLLLYFLKLFSVGIFTYFFLRQIEIRHYASTIGAVAFMFCQYNISWLYWPIANVMFFLPLSLFLTEKILFSKNKVFPWLLAIATAVALFGGHPETFIHIILVNILYFIFRIATSSGLAESKIRIVLRYTMAILFGFLLACAQIVPFYEYSLNSWAYYARTFTDNPYFLQFSTVSLNFIPDLFGNPAYHQYFLKSTNYNESNGGYVGLAMLFFAGMSFFYFYKKKVILFFSFLAFFSLAIVYKAPFLFKMFTALPIFNKLANHRMLFILAFSLVVAGSFWLSEFFESRINISGKSRFFSWLVFSLVAAISSILSIKSTYADFKDADFFSDYIGKLAAFAALDLIVLLSILLFLKKPKLFFPAVLALVFLETGAHGALFQPAIEKKYFFPENQLTEFLRSNAGDFRFTSVSDTALFPPNVATFYRLSDIKNYDAMLAKNYKRELDAHSENNTTFQLTKHINKEYLDLVGVKYIVASSPKELAKKLSLSEEETSTYPIVFSGKKFHVSENTRVLPRAFLTSAGKAQIDPVRKQDILLDENNYANIEKNEPQEIFIEAKNSETVSLILSDTYFPGWTASVDGVDAEIEETASSFRKINLGPGKHRVAMKYKPRSFFLGSLISWLALIIIVFHLFKYGFRRHPE